MIGINNLNVMFNLGGALETHALKNLSLTINQGEFITVIGSNGAGKSTLLGAIAGDVPLMTGKIYINNTDVSATPAYARAELVARVFQDPLAGTCANLSIEDNLALAHARGRRRGLTTAITNKKRQLFRDRLRTLNLGLENRLSDTVGTLSGGQRQALSLMMATLANSEILLLDEHTAALDPRMAAFVLELTEQIYRDYNLTVFMVTHSMQSALNLGGRTVMLHQGNIVLDIAGEERAAMQPADLLRLFSTTCGESAADNDKMLLTTTAP